MTDEIASGTASSGPASGEPHDAFFEELVPPAPAPLPVPVSAPARRSRARTAWIAAIATVTVIGLCLGSYLLGDWLLRETGPSNGLDPSLFGDGSAYVQDPVSIYWSADGAYIVIQAMDRDDKPAVRVLDAQGETVKYLPGHRVVGVEPHAPRIWVVPDTRVVHSSDSWEATSDVLIDYAGDGVDGRPEELLSLRFLEDKEPRADVDARWTRWEGPGGYAASLEIDVNSGAAPSSVRFGDRVSHLNVWKAKMPTDVVSFEPIGWSPSGQYFAVISQVPRASAERILEQHKKDLEEDEEGELPWDPEATCTVVVFKASDGSVAARADAVTFLYSPNGSARAAWHPDDTLSFLDWQPSGPTLWHLKPGSAPADPRVGQQWNEYRQSAAAVVGTDATSTLLVVRNASTYETLDLWRANAQTSSQSSVLVGNDCARWHPARGMLTLLSVGGEGASGWNVYLSDIGGGGRRLVTDIEPPASDDEPLD